MRNGPRTWLVRAAALLLAAALPAYPADPAAPPAVPPDVFPLAQVKPGMKGVAHTIFEGDRVESFEVEVVGILRNFFGPKQDIILVKLKGPRPEYTGVAFGMSGSPVYLEGKLAGAISLTLNIFAKEPVAGVTPIERIFEIEEAAKTERAPGALRPAAGDDPASAGAAPFALPAEVARHLEAPAGAHLVPIDTPLSFAGFHPATLRQFSEAFRALGMVATAGGTAEPQPDDAQLGPGEMASLVLVRGDLSLQASCTVTAVVGERVYACGHPFFGFGRVEMPMARGRVVTTLASSMASTKVVNAGGIIGTFQQDVRTAVVGRLGPAPSVGQGLIPVELTFATPTQERTFRFEVVEHAKLTPLLVGVTLFNGLVANPVYGEGTTLQLSGEIGVRGHSRVTLESMFVPGDQFVPDALSVVLAVQGTFSRVFTNPYERADIEGIRLRVTSLPERRWAVIDSAWSEKSEVSPGEEIHVKVLLRPYRGAPVMKEVAITIPPQAPQGSLRILVSDAETLNRMGRFFTLGPQSRLAGLEQLITLMNRERRNDRLYVTLLQPNPTLLVEDKELPNAPLSQINVLDQRRAPGSSLLLRESNAGEWSAAMNQVISGQYLLTIQVR